MPRVILIAVVVLLATAAPAAADRTLVVDGLGGVHTFVVGSDGALYHAAPGAALTRLGGNLVQEPVAAARSADGRLAVFARGLDNALYSTIQSGSTWSAWVPLGTQ